MLIGASLGIQGHETGARSRWTMLAYATQCFSGLAAFLASLAMCKCVVLVFLEFVSSGAVASAVAALSPADSGVFGAVARCRYQTPQVGLVFLVFGF